MLSNNKQPIVDQWFVNDVVQDSPFAIFAHSIHPISAEARAYINEKTFKTQISKGELLVQADEICNALYLVERGILRGYVKDGRKEITTWITTERQLVTSITGFDKQIPAKENIQAIEDCELTAIYHKDLYYLYEHHSEMNIVSRKLLEEYYRHAEERAFIARLTEATTKYKYFIATSSHLLNRVPLKFIASYLGMTLETLSRIRGKLSRTVQ
ncbi:MAG: Crp/Fnr family transcriptional regulator [Chitinophagaceae bacterium]